MEGEVGGVVKYCLLCIKGNQLGHNLSPKLDSN